MTSVLDHHLQRGLHPPRIRAPERPLPNRVVHRSQSRLAVLAEIVDPAFERAHADAQFGSLGYIPAFQRQSRVKRRPGLLVSCQLGAAGSVTGEHLPDMSGSLCDALPLMLGHLGQHHTRRVTGIVR